MKTLDQIIATVTANGMREITEERCKQVAEEWAEQARREERDKLQETISEYKECFEETGEPASPEESKRIYDAAKNALQREGGAQ